MEKEIQMILKYKEIEDMFNPSFEMQIKTTLRYSFSSISSITDMSIN